jgi:RNA polymerase sigma-70 factor (ECF subfamily)
MTVQEQTAEALLVRVAERDEEALAKLYALCGPGLLGMALRILPNRRAAEEVVEDVFVRLWNEARHHARAGHSVAAWLVMATRNAAIERRRAERRLPVLPRRPSRPPQDLFFRLPQPEEFTQLVERHDLLKKVVNQLPRPQRHALELAVFEGFTETEIAEKLGEPLGRVQAALRAGMRFLRHRLRAVTGTWAASI